MDIATPPGQNHLLAQLPQAERDRWLPKLELIDMPLGQVLYESGVTLKYVYFPTTSIVSLLCVLQNGASAEIAVVGNEGIIGESLFMGDGSTPSRGVVKSAGKGYRLSAQLMTAEFDKADAESRSAAGKRACDDPRNDRQYVGCTSGGGHGGSV